MDNNIFQHNLGDASTASSNLFDKLQSVNTVQTNRISPTVFVCSVDENGVEYRAFPATDLLFERRKDAGSLREPQFTYDQKLSRLRFSAPFELVFAELEAMI